MKVKELMAQLSKLEPVGFILNISPPPSAKLYILSLGLAFDTSVLVKGLVLYY